MSDEFVDLDEMPNAVLILRSGIVADASPSASSLLGVDRSDLLGARVLDLVSPDDVAALASLLTSAVPARKSDEGVALGEIAVRTASPAHRSLGVLVSAGHDGRLVAALRDLTIERRLSGVIDSVADSTLLLDRDGQLLWQSEALAARVPGGAANLATHPVERLHPEDLPMVLEAFADLARQPGGRLTRVVRSRAIDNDDIWQLIELIASSRVDHPELNGVVVQVRNLEGGDELESIGQTDGPLLSLAEAAPVGILLMSRVEHVVYASGMGRSLLGFGEADDTTDWRDRVADSHRQQIDTLVAGGLIGAQPATITTPFVLPDGAHRWMRVRVAPHLDARRQPVGVIVALEDVTAEVEARTESQRLLDMVDATSDYVVIFRPSGEILHTNAALAQVLEGHRLAGGTGKLRDLLDDREQFIERGLEVIATSDTWHGEIMLNVSPGHQIPVSALAVVRRDEDGELDWIAMVARDITELKEAEERLRHLATSDHLTGLANRALFTEQLELVVANSRRTGRGVAVLFCDLDRFKEVNDQHGHTLGDQVLVEIADRLRTIIREEDLVARVGGDEFVILCDGAAEADALAALAERVIAAIHAPIEVGDSSVQVGISIGVAIGRHGGISGDRILTRADQAMYRAKATGGNRYRIVDVEDS